MIGLMVWWIRALVAGWWQRNVCAPEPLNLTALRLEREAVTRLYVERVFREMRQLEDEALVEDLLASVGLCRMVEEDGA